MKLHTTNLPGVVIFEPKVYEDNRGHFFELWRENNYLEKLNVKFVQDNLSFSTRNVVRGLHYQLKQPQDKLVMALHGTVLDVVVDLRQGSSTFGEYITVELSDKNNRQLFVPRGFAHGFCVLSETALFLYKCSDYYAPGDEHGIVWDDPTLNIEWPVTDSILADKDRLWPRLADITSDQLPQYSCIAADQLPQYL